MKVLKLVSMVLMLSVAVWGLGNDEYEVWSIDQSNSPGKSFGGTIYIWDGHDLEKHEHPIARKIDLGSAAAALCLAKTGTNPVRPHMLTMNASNTHAIVSFVATGHVLFINADLHQPVDCIQTSVGSTGVRQAHQSYPSPDETYVAVANQNGKLYERINTNYATETFILDPAATIDLATCTTPNAFPCQSAALRPDNAPICPIIDSSSILNFVTLRGGGLFVIDAKATPMQIVAEYDRFTIHPNGCLGAQVGNKMYVDSGGGTANSLYEADLYAFPLGSGLYSSKNGPDLPTPKVVFSEDVQGADAHGAALTRHNNYLWIADRGRNFLFVVDTATDVIVNRINLVSGPLVLNQLTKPTVVHNSDGTHHPSDDPTPDLLVLSPSGKYMFMSLRGPNPLSGDPHVSTGSTTGVGVLKVTEGGRNGIFRSVAPMSNIDDENIERADGHALWVRLKRK